MHALGKVILIEKPIDPEAAGMIQKVYVDWGVGGENTDLVKPPLSKKNGMVGNCMMIAPLAGSWT